MKRRVCRSGRSWKTMSSCRLSPKRDSVAGWPPLPVTVMLSPTVRPFATCSVAGLRTWCLADVSTLVSSAKHVAVLRSTPPGHRPPVHRRSRSRYVASTRRLDTSCTSLRLLSVRARKKSTYDASTTICLPRYCSMFADKSFTWPSSASYVPRNEMPPVTKSASHSNTIRVGLSSGSSHIPSAAAASVLSTLILTISRSLSSCTLMPLVAKYSSVFPLNVSSLYM